MRGVVAIALAQGVVLRLLHHLAEGEFGRWSELVVLLPAYACTVGVPLTYYLLRSHLPGRTLGRLLAAVGLILFATAAYVGWVNAPLGDLRPAVQGSVCFYTTLAVVAWFVALPFLRLGLRGTLTAPGYVALFDEAWRLAITLAFAQLFVQVFWILLVLFMALFDGIHVDWPRRVISKPSFYYPATCVAASFAIGLTEVRPEMFRALRQLLLALLRWLTVLAAAIVLLFLATLVLEGVAALWSTHFATWSLIVTGCALVTLYNAVYQDGVAAERLPRLLSSVVRGALVVGPALAALAFWALTLRIREHGVSEDRLNALVAVVILAGYLVGYSIVSVLGRRAPFDIRHVNVVMALTVVGTVLVIQSPLVDFKRIAVASQLARVAEEGVRFDFRYLRFDTGRHGLVALRELGRSETPLVARQAQIALAEANRGPDGARGGSADRARFLARIEVYPEGKQLPDELVEQLFAVYRDSRWRLWCIDQGTPCIALVTDLNGDGRDEVVLPLPGDGTVYAHQGNAWVKVGRLQPGRFGNVDDLRHSLIEGRIRTLPPVAYGGLEIGTSGYAFAPCVPGEPGCEAPPP